MEYAELQVTSNFSFLRGASHPDELIDQAAALGYAAIAITDRNTLAGVVRAHVAAKAKGLRLVIGCRLDLMDGPSLLVYPSNKNGYARLSTLLTIGNRRAEKGKCELYKADIITQLQDVKIIVVPPDILHAQFDFDEAFTITLQEYAQIFSENIYLAASRKYNGQDQKYLFRLLHLSKQCHVPLIATNDVYYHVPARRELQDVLTCIREKCTIHNAGFKLHGNAERYLKPIVEMERLFIQYPHAITRTTELINACSFSLDELEYVYPTEITTQGRTPQEELERLTWVGAHKRYGDTIPGKSIKAIEHELNFIRKMNYASYFLTVHDIVRFARSQNILCQGRGSAANSTVCYCLGITSVNPEKFDLLFERFLSAARNEPPDIDVDFEHERREEVMQYIFNKYGRDRAAIVATVTQQHQRGAIRDVGKAMGLSADTITRMSSSVWEFTTEWFTDQRLLEQGINPKDQHLKKVLQLTQQYIGFPRQLGQHTGGFVITAGKLHDLCPILNARMADRTCIEWNKDDIDALGLLKIDVLALGMLTCIRKNFDLAKKHYNKNFTLANIPQDDPGVYEMIGRADTIGVFQIESRAQQSMLPRLKPKNFYDLVIEVAIVRPGPILGDMVHPYLRRRNGEEAIEYPSKELEDILGRTLGVPLFQEQAMKIAIVAAGFSPTEADELRRSMATFKLKGMVSKFERMLIDGMLRNGYTQEYAQRVFKQLEGFGSYGFPESHAASFALLVYVSCWLKCYYPDVFACGLLNSQPMGFYHPAQIISDARKHEVEVRPIDINESMWDYKLEPTSGKYHAIRLGFRQIKGLHEDDIHVLVEKRITPYQTIDDLRDAGIAEKALEKLAEADAFRSIGLDRRQALWELTTHDHPGGIFTGQSATDTKVEQIELPFMTPAEHVVQDYASTSLSIKAHPVSFVRPQLKYRNNITAQQLLSTPHDAKVKISGLVLVRQRPGTAGGVCFMTIEDETGTANLVVFQKLFDRYRKEILQSRLLMVEGKVQRQGEVIHVVVRHCFDLTFLFKDLTPSKQDLVIIESPMHADEKVAPPYITQNKKTQIRYTEQEIVFPAARNFR